MIQNEKLSGLLPRALLRVWPAATIVMVAIGVMTSMVINHTLDRQVTTSLQKDARFAAKTVSARLDAILSSVRSVAANDLVINALVDTEAREAYVPLYFNQLQIAGVRTGAKISFTDYRGRMIAANWAAKDYTGAKWLYRVIENGQEYSSFGATGAVLAIPVIYERRAEGAIVLEMNRKQLARVLALSLGNSSVIISNKKYEIFSSDPKFSSSYWRDGKKSRDWMQASVDVDGHSGLSTTVAQHVDVAFAATNRLERSLYLTLLLALIALAAGIVSTAYLTTSPLQKFVSELKRFGVARDLSRRVVPEGTAEFHELANSFNSMLERLQKTVVSHEQLQREVDMRKRAEEIRRKARREVRNRDARTRAIVDTAHEGIVAFDANGVIESFNSAATRIFGYGADEIIGSNIRKLVSKNKGTGFDSSDWQYVAAGTPGSAGSLHEVEGRRRDGSVFPMDLAISPMSIDGQEMFTGMIRDITDRKKAEAALQEQNERFNVALENMSHGVCVFDRHGTLIFSNKRYATLYGLSPEELKPGISSRRIAELRAAKGIYAGQSPDEYVQDRVDWGTAGEDNDVSAYEFNDGRSIRSARQPLSDGGWVSTHEDITQSRRMERLKNEFVSVVSHELRTPLTSMAGALRLIRSGKLGEMPEKACSLLDIASRNTDRLTILVNDILDMEKIKADRLDFTFSTVDIARLAGQAVRENTAFGDEYQVRFRVENRIGAACAEVDEHRIIQVLTNLLSNAAKFSDPGSEVVVRVSRENGKIRIAVIDHGVGIDEEKQEQLFDRFFQVDASDSRSKMGTGLGLAIVKAIVAKHGSNIRVHSRVGEGSVFYFDLDEVEQTYHTGTEGSAGNGVAVA
jgi:PAS domain S-box-containing protein